MSNRDPTDIQEVNEAVQQQALNAFLCKLEEASYLRAERCLLVKVALHKVTIFSGGDFTPQRKQNGNVTCLLFAHHVSGNEKVTSLCEVMCSPPLGSNAAGPTRDGAVYMRQVGVVPCVVPGTDLKQSNSLFEIWPL